MVEKDWIGRVEGLGEVEGMKWIHTYIGIYNYIKDAHPSMPF